MPSWDPQANVIFLAALDCPTPQERADYLARVCPPGNPLRPQVDALLSAHLAADKFLTQSSDEEQNTWSVPSSAEVAGEGLIGTVVVEKYKLLQVLGEGGMGSVYLAEQLHPVKRLVALKAIRAGASSKSVLARFEAERQALALMDHPHIAKVLDAGATDQGQPFFVMDLVRGVPLTDFCNARLLNVEQRLTLFQQVCLAVQHAHQKGIIHRDLKPSNILVESHDGVPVPKIIDFGLAKAMHALPLTDHSLLTQFGAIVGTPLYMAPEQAEGSAIDIDTRADIYALGVILYELLTGSTPIERRQLARAAWDEIRRLIKHEEPPRPSTRLGSSDDLASIAAQRQSEPSKLGRLIRGDLDWIVMKALSKERDHRYDSAAGFAQDISRFLNHEPVSAGPPSLGYRAAKFVRRHRGAVFASGLLLATLIVGVAGTTWGLFAALRARAAEAVARRSEGERADQERRARESEQRAKEIAEERLRQLERGTAILGSIFEGLNAESDDQEGKSLRVLLGERLDFAVQSLEAESLGDPLTAARLRKHLGRSLLSLGYPQKAIPLLELSRTGLAESLGATHRDTLSTASELATANLHAGRLAAAVAEHRKILEISVAQFGPEDQDTVTETSNLGLALSEAGQYAEAISLLEQVLTIRRRTAGFDSPATFLAMSNLAACYGIAGRLHAARGMLEEADEQMQITLGPDHPHTLLCLSNLAECLSNLGDPVRAIELGHRVVAGQQRTIGPNHHRTLQSQANLAGYYLQSGDNQKAQQLMSETLAQCEKYLSPDHPTTLSCLDVQAGYFFRSGKAADAVRLYEQAWSRAGRKLGENHLRTLHFMVMLGSACDAAQQRDRAIALLTDAIRRMRSQLDQDHPELLIALNNLANAHAEAGHTEEARELLEDAAAVSRKKLGADHPDTIAQLTNLATYCLNANHVAEARAQYEEIVALVKTPTSVTAQRALWMAKAGLATVHHRERNFEQAKRQLEEIHGPMQEQLGPTHPDTLECLFRLVGLFRDCHEVERALPLLEVARRLLDSENRAPSPAGLRVRYELGRAHSDLGQYDAAMGVLEGLTAAAGPLAGVPPQAPSVRALLAQCYDRGGQPRKAEPLYREIAREAEQKFGRQDLRTAIANAQVGQNLLLQERWTDAESALRDALDIGEQVQAESWVTGHCRVQLGAALLGQGKLADAEPLLLAGFQLLKAQRMAAPPQGLQSANTALEHLIRLYETWQKPDERQRWERELAEWKK